MNVVTIILVCFWFVVLVWHTVENILPMKVKVFNNSNNPLPEYETEGSAGMDLRYDGPSVIISPGNTKLLPTNLHIEVPRGYEAQVRNRSGLALKSSLCIPNGVGTIDSDYRGSVGIILTNLGSSDFTVNPGDRVGQLVFNKVENIKWIPVRSLTDLSDTSRGQGGFGHTGKK